jgi:hypothetical protein
LVGEPEINTRFTSDYKVARCLPEISTRQDIGFARSKQRHARRYDELLVKTAKTAKTAKTVKAVKAAKAAKAREEKRREEKRREGEEKKKEKEEKAGVAAITPRQCPQTCAP